MQPLPDCIVSKMDDATPLVLNALSQLEAFLAEYNMCLYRSRPKHVYARDFALMMAVDDLDAIASQLLDAAGDPIFEHRIQMQQDDDRDTLIERFKHLVQNEQGCTVSSERVADHASPIIYRNGKTNYEDWLLIRWEDDSTPTPASLSRASVHSLAQEAGEVSPATHHSQLSIASSSQPPSAGGMLRLTE